MTNTNESAALYWAQNHVHQEPTGWWFWDETEADKQGPYQTKEDAVAGLLWYCEWLDSENA